MLKNKNVFLFDMDGLLLDTEALHVKLWHKIFDKYHLSLNITEDYRMTDIVYLPKEEGDTEASIEFLKKRWKGRAF